MSIFLFRIIFAKVVKSDKIAIDFLNSCNLMAILPLLQEIAHLFYIKSGSSFPVKNKTG